MRTGNMRSRNTMLYMRDCFPMTMVIGNEILATSFAPFFWSSPDWSSQVKSRYPGYKSYFVATVSPRSTRSHNVKIHLTLPSLRLTKEGGTGRADHMYTPPEDTASGPGPGVFFWNKHREIDYLSSRISLSSSSCYRPPL